MLKNLISDADFKKCNGLSKEWIKKLYCSWAQEET